MCFSRKAGPPKGFEKFQKKVKNLRREDPDQPQEEPKTKEKEKEAASREPKEKPKEEEEEEMQENEAEKLVSKPKEEKTKKAFQLKEFQQDDPFAKSKFFKKDKKTNNEKGGPNNQKNDRDKVFRLLLTFGAFMFFTRLLSDNELAHQDTITYSVAQHPSLYF